MQTDNFSDDVALETAEGLIRLFGPDALRRADLILNRMKKHKDENGAILWGEVAGVLRRMQGENPPAAEVATALVPN